MQVELYVKIPSAKYNEPSPTVISGQEPLLFNFCSGFKRSKRGANEKVRRVFEKSNVLELLGSQLLSLGHLKTDQGSDYKSTSQRVLGESIRFTLYMASMAVAGTIKPSW
ncbi:hypothetical protein F2P56_001859 [Juglans regia]|uniref:Uncharacterized protein n=1 Tax=Juglans regia TaxID=51240 RepID=A0A833YEE0_JUGRE|nr:hypothetical protein F2P56_001859 [Juglans regia]